MSEKSSAELYENSTGNSALDWEIFDILCRDELGLNVSVGVTKSCLILFMVITGW